MLLFWLRWGFITIKMFKCSNVQWHNLFTRRCAYILYIRGFYIHATLFTFYHHTRLYHLFSHVAAVFNGTPISSATCNHWLLLNLSSISLSNRSRSETFLFFTSTLSINEMIWVACRYNGSAIDRQASVEALHQFLPCPSASVFFSLSRMLSSLFYMCCVCAHAMV